MLDRFTGNDVKRLEEKLQSLEETLTDLIITNEMLLGPSRFTKGMTQDVTIHGKNANSNEEALAIVQNHLREKLNLNDIQIASITSYNKSDHFIVFNAGSMINKARILSRHGAMNFGWDERMF